MHPACDELEAIWLRLFHFDHLQSIAGWDQSAMMPPGGSAARAALPPGGIIAA